MLTRLDFSVKILYAAYMGVVCPHTESEFSTLSSETILR